MAFDLIHHFTLRLHSYAMILMSEHPEIVNFLVSYVYSKGFFNSPNQL